MLDRILAVGCGRGKGKGLGEWVFRLVGLLLGSVKALFCPFLAFSVFQKVMLTIVMNDVCRYDSLMTLFSVFFIMILLYA